MGSLFCSECTVDPEEEHFINSFKCMTKEELIKDNIYLTKQILVYRLKLNEKIVFPKRFL